MWSWLQDLVIVGIALAATAAALGEVACPTGKTPVQSIDKPLSSNGCTKPAFLTVQGEEDFTHCCDLHDACYSVCGTTQEFCDREFLKCMNQLCDQVFPSNSACKEAASTYNMGATLFGASLFQESQTSHCVCTETDAVLTHYKTYVDQFYDKHVKGAAKKTADEILKSDSKYLKTSGSDEKKTKYSHIHKIVLDLHKKYETAIAHIDARKEKKSVPKLPKKKREL